MATLAISTYTSCLIPNEASQNIKITFQTNKEKQINDQPNLDHKQNIEFKPKDGLK